MTRKSSGFTDQHAELIGFVSASEACRICHVEIEFIHALVMEGVFELESSDPSDWRFDPRQLAVLRKATRLHQDLDVNPPGIALALELLRLLERTRHLR